MRLDRLGRARDISRHLQRNPQSPAPAAVATAMASQSAEPVASLFVFTISIGSVNFFGRPLGRGNAIFPSSPPAEVNQLAAPAAKRPVRIAGVFGLFLASRTLQWRTILPMRSYSILPVISTL